MFFIAASMDAQIRQWLRDNYGVLTAEALSEGAGCVKGIDMTKTRGKPRNF